MSDDQANALSATAPVEMIDTASKHREPEEGIALCLSGGGYRAMLFHLGSLWRINELGLLSKIDRISSVSGGSITAGVLGMNWKGLEFDANGVAANYQNKVVDPIRYLAGKTIDRKAIFGGALAPGSISDKVAGAYRKYLFSDRTLQDLPDDPPESGWRPRGGIPPGPRASQRSRSHGRAPRAPRRASCFFRSRSDLPRE